MGGKIYITDDEPSVLDVLSAFLRHAGFAVETFTSGAAVIAACERELPDLAVLDVLMPGMDGFCVCRTLRCRYPELPVIFISSKDSPADRAAGAAAGGDDYLGKPFLPMDLAARINALFRRRDASAAHAARPGPVPGRDCPGTGAGPLGGGDPG